jgi:hypothetical protein
MIEDRCIVITLYDTTSTDRSGLIVWFFDGSIDHVSIVISRAAALISILIDRLDRIYIVISWATVALISILIDGLMDWSRSSQLPHKCI